MLPSDPCNNLSILSAVLTSISETVTAFQACVSLQMYLALFFLSITVSPSYPTIFNFVLYFPLL